MTAAALEVRGLTLTFPFADERIPVVDHLDLSLAHGETLALVGESGCGKSMTALALMRLVPRPGRIESGSVRLDGEEIFDLPVAAMRRVRGGRMALIFQEPMTSLNPVVCVGAQLVEAIRLHEPVSAAAARARARELLVRVGIPDAAARFAAYPHQLSGGLRQRVMIAMAVAARPSVLIADEPTTALDVTIQAQILALLRELQREEGTAILLITHDLGVVAGGADRVAVMYAGRIVEQASCTDLLATPRHPYSRGLLAATPAAVRPGTRLAEIPGTVPAPAQWGRGCRFAPRCPLAVERCRRDVPPLVAVADGWSVACPVTSERCHG